MVVRKIALVGVAALAFSASALADDSGFYIGGQLGAGWQDVGSKVVTVNGVVDNGVTYNNVAVTSKGSKKAGLAGRISGGYNFNKNFGAEVGYTKFKDTNINFAVIFPPPSTLLYTGKGHVKTQMVDVLAKGVLPVDDNFSLYGKAGVAYVDSQLKVYEFHHTTKRFRPEAVVGAAYNFDEHTSLDVSYAHVWGTGNVYSKHFIPNLGLAAVGVTYKF